MYIEPNSTIKLLYNVPLSVNNTDTLMFEDIEEQELYFEGKVLLGATFNNNSYQRVTAGTCRLNTTISRDINGVNYMMFKNTAYENKWFYAFVTDVRYVNNSAIEIDYEIDEIQTWLFEYDVDECFVERENTITDEIGEHIEPENVGCGEYVCDGNIEFIDEPLGEIGHWRGDYVAVVVLAAAARQSGAQSSVVGSMIEKQFCCSKVFGFRVLDGNPYRAETQLGLLNDLIDTLTEQGSFEDIQNIFMCPAFLFKETWNNGVAQLPDCEITDEDINYDGVEAEVNGVDETSTLNGYMPKNNKMRTYPYTYLSLQTSSEQLTLRYEFFEDNPSFVVTGNIIVPVEIVCRPMNYRNFSNSGIPFSSTKLFYPEKLTINAFPLCNWSATFFDQWLAQQGTARLLSTGGAVIGSALTSLATGNLLPLATSGVTGIMGVLADVTTAYHQPNLTGGNFASGSHDYAHNLLHFWCQRMSITKQFAKRIDDYFTAFGYNVGVVKKPNRINRDRFTYIKTNGCNVHGLSYTDTTVNPPRRVTYSIPCSSAKRIADIYNNGIRFWIDTDHFGDYSIANEPLGEES